VEAILRGDLDRLHDSDKALQKAPRRDAKTESVKAARLHDDAVALPSMPGKGGQLHKFIQQMIRQWGIDAGFRARVEKEIGEGNESVDIVLERDGLSIACEISVTTPIDYELGNLGKCLKMGFNHVLVISSEPAKLAGIREAALAAFGEAALSSVRFLSPQDVFGFLTATGAGSTGAVSGYNVKVLHDLRNGPVRTAKNQALDALLSSVVQRDNRR
jgi:hypothetical protein